MELRQLVYFVAVVDEASFTRAAAKLHVAQPGVSAQLRQLEREVGEPLLDRSGRTVRPTEAGLAMLPYARAALDAVAGARASIEELTGLVRGQVRVGTVAYLASVDLPGLLAAFHQRHPDVDITVLTAAPEQLAEQLRTGQLDLVLIGAGTSDDTIATQVVADEPIVAVVGRDHPLAGRSAVTIAGLAQHRLNCLPRGTGLRTAVDAACTAEGVRPHVAFESADPRVLIEFAAQGLGVALVAESAARTRSTDTHLLTVAGAPRVRMVLGWRRDGPTGPAARALIRHARTTLPDIAADRD